MVPVPVGLTAVTVFTRVLQNYTHRKYKSKQFQEKMVCFIAEYNGKLTHIFMHVGEE